MSDRDRDADPPTGDGPGGVLAVYLTGVLMGAADTVPGVSGGTIALIAGIYERLIRAVTAVDPRILARLPSARDPEARAELLADLQEMDLPFLAVLGLGIVSAVVTVARLIEAAVHAAPAATAAFFCGLIGASAVVLYRQLEGWTPRRAALAGVTVVAVALATGVTGSATPHTLPVVFLAGTFAISAMVLPGVSGAFLLLLVGQYGYLRGVLISFTDALLALAAGGDLERVLETGVPVAVFCAGAAIGLVTVAHAIRLALDRYREATLTVLVSLMVGGLRPPAERAARGLTPLEPAGVATVLAGAVVGVAVVAAIDSQAESVRIG